MKTFIGATLLVTLFAFTTPIPQSATNEDRSEACVCGLQNKAKRIVGGTETDVNEYPWVVAIIKTEKGTNGLTYFAQVCGGSLISRNWVLSASHCFTKTGVTAANTMISLGDHDLGSKAEANSVNRNVSKIVTHPLYNSNTYNNDIALLKMGAPVEFTSNIQPICLPPKTLCPYGKTGTVAGWGKTSENGSSSLKLNEVSLPVLSQDKCKSAYGSTVTKKMFCAGYMEGKKDACQGDSGGPFFYKCPSTSRYIQLGIVSYGEGCAKPNFPGVYSSVMCLRDFIEMNTEGEKFCATECKA